ncbi:MAG: glycosyltransferase, partial [Weeksellaceae bacterium]|nr:glycosyltransferase [Weeksellaceae bacterium]
MISVCLATYNGEKYLEAQIKSILKQLSVDDELIISDDRSTDNTISVINKFDDNRIKIFINKNKNGVAHNFENALLKATGDYIFLSDQDDIWADNKVDVLLKELKEYD